VRITRLYHPGKLLCGETTSLDKDSSSHLVRVLRTKTESPVILFNGDSYDYHCITLDDNPKKTRLSVQTKTESSNESNLNITLIQGLSRHDRMEATIQKSVELGANKIAPVVCRRSNTRIAKDKQQKKLAHWQKVAISACEQSGRNRIPEIKKITSLASACQALNGNALKIILNPEAKTSLKDINFNPQEKNNGHIEIFIGPEGGLTDEEISLLQENQFVSICFGPRILRTETAGPAVISALQMLWGDF